jgi:hypothetical protein
VKRVVLARDLQQLVAPAQGIAHAPAADRAEDLRARVVFVVAVPARGALEPRALLQGLDAPADQIADGGRRHARQPFSGLDKGRGKARNSGVSVF